MCPFRFRRRSLTVASFFSLFLLLLLFLAPAGSGQEAMASDAEETVMTTESAVPSAPPGKEAAGDIDNAADVNVPLLPGWLRWIWESGAQEGGQKAPVSLEDQKKEAEFELAQATVAALALLIAFLTVAQLWQVPPPSTSLTDPVRTARAKAAASAEPAGSAASTPVPRVTTTLFDSNFSRTVLSGLGGLAVVSVADNLWDRAGLYAEPYYFILFVAFFLLGLAATAVLRGLGEAVRSRITLNRPAVIWPPAPWRLLQWLRYWLRRLWYWIVSFRATLLVFLDTTFNVLIGKNQLQSAVFSETITDLHEGLLQAAERVRDEVHQAVVHALKPSTSPSFEDGVRVAVSLLSEDESHLYYIAWERGSSPKRFQQGTLAWLAAFTGHARWMKLDAPNTEARTHWDKIYVHNAQAIAVRKGGKAIPGFPDEDLPLKKFYGERGDQDYEGFVVLPMPWTSRGVAGEHRKGAIHISFRRANDMDHLWKHLEAGEEGDERPNFEEWRGILEADFGIVIKDPVLGAVLHEALEVLGEALAHFDDDVYDVYVQARQHPVMAPL